MTRSTSRFLAIMCLIPAALLFIALIDGLPYGYFTFLRLVLFVAGFIYTFQMASDRKMALAVLSVLMVLLFNPIIPVHLDRETWVVIDAIAGVVWIGLAVAALLGGPHTRKDPNT